MTSQPSPKSKSHKSDAEKIEEDVPHLSKSALKERGWTDKAIRDFAGQPHKTAINPRYRSAPAVQLWRLEFVEEVELSQPFQEFVQSHKLRKEGAIRAGETKRAKLIEEVEHIRVRVPKMSEERLIKAACKHYNTRQENREELTFNIATPESDVDFLHRICVNYLRHRLTKYDQILSDIEGRMGINDAYINLSVKIMTRIGDAYPFLKSECNRQLAEREAEV